MLLFVGCDDNITDSLNNFNVTMYDTYTSDAIMKFSEPLDLNQFTIQSWLSGGGLAIECPENTPEGQCAHQGIAIPVPDTSNIYKIISSPIFGVECCLIYDNNFFTLTGYSVSMAEYPEGTGEECNPLFIDNVRSINGEYLSSEISYEIHPNYSDDNQENCYNNICPDTNHHPSVVPNPFFNTYLYNEMEGNPVIRFTHLPSSCMINIFNGNREIITSISYESSYNFHGNSEWNYVDDIEDSGIYFYEITSNDEMLHQGSIVILLQNDTL